METRTILLTSLVLALWTSTTTGQDYCEGKVDGSYCLNCWQPVDCTDGALATVYPPCEKDTACTVDFGVSFCTSHTETECFCSGAGDQCDAYHPNYIEHCYASGPFLVELCPDTTPICVNSECVQHPPCTESDAWNLTPDCTTLFYCDANSVIYDRLTCEDGKYVNSDYECALPPIPACDGSCTGRCPNPVDCTKFFICDGTTFSAQGACPADTFFDIDTNVCLDSGYTCTFLNGCDIEVETEITTTSEKITTTRDGTTSTRITDTTTISGIITTTVGSPFTVPPDATCNSSTVGNKYPSGSCSRQYYVCEELALDQYGYILRTCLEDYYFNTDPASPYCTVREDIATCL